MSKLVLNRYYRSVLSKWEIFIKMRAAFLALSFLHNSREDGGKKRAALILMKISHFDRTPLYSIFWKEKGVSISFVSFCNFVLPFKCDGNNHENWSCQCKHLSRVDEVGEQHDVSLSRNSEALPVKVGLRKINEHSLRISQSKLWVKELEFN